MIDENKSLDVLLSEYKRTTTNIHNINTMFLSLQGIPLVGMFAAFGLFKDFPHLALVLPFFALYLAYNVSKYTLIIFEYGGYASFLEDRINEYYTEKVLLQESVFIEKRKHFFNGGLLQIFFMLPVYLAFGYFYFMRAKTILETGVCWKIVIIIGLSTALCLATLALLYHITLLFSAKKESKKMLSEYINNIETPNTKG